ncbi:YbaB/EbfC family nucleoid-associated protein [Saccharothrix deserti]|uniref:YbaB/EbfC family nucleoid-associated protein n=1 Tax=Saccharothrix deserti TaxID=2593674 RepID=UPI00131C39DF|nr:YbaB/EbfC family nucleoid-associated protein [Saccharothrix deserti]
MNDPAHRAALEARNAALRSQVDTMLVNLERQTAALKEAQAAAPQTATATSPDGLVQAVVNAAGVVTDVKLAPSAFERSTPDKLSRAIVQTIQQATLDVRRQAEEALAPFQNAMPDLPDLFPGAPSLKNLLPQPPPPVERPRRARDEDPDEESGPVLRGDGW